MNTNVKNSVGTSVIPELPILTKYFGDDAMQKGQKVFNQWRKGEKPIGAIVALILIGLAAWGLVGWVLPMLFAAIGAWVSVVAPIGLTLLLVMSWKGIYKAFRSIARAIHKRALRWKPFDEFTRQIEKMHDNLSAFLSFKAIIKKLRSQFEQTAQKERDEAEQAEADFKKQKLSADKTKADMESMLAKNAEAKDTDEYNELEQKLMNAVSAANRANSTLEKSKQWATQYAARANVFGKLDRKLALGATRLENMIKDFEKQVDLWQKDVEGAESSRKATSILKKMVSGNNGNWELEYVIEFVTNKIAEDYAVTAQNIEDLNRITTDFDFNSDDAYAQLDAIAEKITGSSIPDVDKIARPNHKLTEKEKNAAGALGDIQF